MKIKILREMPRNVEDVLIYKAEFENNKFITMKKIESLFFNVMDFDITCNEGYCGLDYYILIDEKKYVMFANGEGESDDTLIEDAFVTKSNEMYDAYRANKITLEEYKLMMSFLRGQFNK